MAPDQTSRPVGYRRSAGSPRGEARRADLLARVTDDLADNGLTDFSLRRAARAAHTTHKVLLYYFDGPDDLLHQAVLNLRTRRIDKGLVAAARQSTGRALSERVRAIWPVLVGDEGRVLDQAIGLAMYDSGRHAALANDATEQYLPALVSLCPPHWAEERRLEVAQLILATLRGLLIAWRISGETADVTVGLSALGRALDREEAAG